MMEPFVIITKRMDGVQHVYVYIDHTWIDKKIPI